MCPNDTDGMTNSVHPDKNVPFRSSLIWTCTVCSDLSVHIYRIFTIDVFAY